jgi:hypothetical protein
VERDVMHLLFDTRSTSNIYKTDDIKIFLLPILAQKPPKGKTIQIEALMIHETGRKRGEYRRIGTLYGWAQLIRRLEEAFNEPPTSWSDYEVSSGDDETWNGEQDFAPNLVDESKCVEIRVDEDGKKRYIIDLV